MVETPLDCGSRIEYKVAWKKSHLRRRYLFICAKVSLRKAAEGASPAPYALISAPPHNGVMRGREIGSGLSELSLRQSLRVGGSGR